uniref:Putative lipoprotein n=1 Tax=Myxococcus virescens TaxID=83456 RepID=A0A7D5T2C5_9BACT|nr:putative lipoprotein [Myxococcus virescens]
MNASRIIASLTACLALSLAACGGGEDLMEAPQGEAPVSVEQGLGHPPHCPNGDLIYWYENPQACVAKCGTTRQPGRTATEYAACQSNVSGTRTLINVRACIPGCDLH